MSAGRVYNKRMLAFLREHYPTNMTRELTAMFNIEFGKDKTIQQIKSCLMNHDIKAGVRRTRSTIKYNPEHLAFIEDGYKDLNIRRLTAAFNQQFAMKVAESSIRACTRNHGFKSGRNGHFEQGQVSWNKGMKGLNLGGEAGWFKPGFMPINHRELGSERVNVDGYIEIKVAEPRTWDLKHRVVWREQNGDIDSRDCIVFVNNNPLDCSIENLRLISRREHVIINKSGFSAYTDELKDTAITFVKLKVKIKDLA